MNTADTRTADFEARVRADWATDETAAAWQKFYPIMREQLSAVTGALVDAAEVGPGMAVLDLASGTGEPSISIAKRIGPVGRVTATDLNPAMLDCLRQNAAAEGVDNIDTHFADGQDLPYKDDSFDAVTSRFGVMFFADVPRALGEVKRVLRAGGSATFLVWGIAAPGTYLGDTVTPFMKRVAVKPDPDGPGPMRFAEPGKLLRLVEQAGFRETTELTLSLPSFWPGTPDHALDAMLEIATPFRAAVASLSEEDRQAARAEVIASLAARFDGTRIAMTAPAVIVRGVK